MSVSIATKISLTLFSALVSKSNESVSKPCLFHSKQSDIQCPKEDRDEESLSYAKLYSAAQYQESSYSALGEPDLRDLTSFAYQITQGMASIYI